MKRRGRGHRVASVADGERELLECGVYLTL